MAQLQLLIFSGRPDPVMELSKEELEHIKTLIANCTEVGILAKIRLGYRGSYIYDRSNVLPLFVGKGAIQVYDSSVYKDTAGVEDYLISLVKQNPYFKISTYIHLLPPFNDRTSN